MGGGLREARCQRAAYQAAPERLAHAGIRQKRVPGFGRRRSRDDDVCAPNRAGQGVGRCVAEDERLDASRRRAAARADDAAAIRCEPPCDRGPRVAETEDDDREANMWRFSIALLELFEAVLADD